MNRGEAEGRVGIPSAAKSGSGRQSRGGQGGASRVTAKRGHSHPETRQLLEAVVERENMNWDSGRCLITCDCFNLLHEPPCTELYARWCERTGAARPPPTQLSGSAWNWASSRSGGGHHDAAAALFRRASGVVRQELKRPGAV